MSSIDVAKEFRSQEEFHVTASKGWLIREVRQHGAKAVIGRDLPTEEAVTLIQRDPRQSFPIGTSDRCDNHDGFGNCLGHPVTRSKPERCSCSESLVLREELASAAAHVATLLVSVDLRDRESARVWLATHKERLP